MMAITVPSPGFYPVFVQAIELSEIVLCSRLIERIAQTHFIKTADLGKSEDVLICRSPKCGTYGLKTYGHLFQPRKDLVARPNSQLII